MSTKYGINLGMSREEYEYQRLARETPQANKAFFAGTYQRKENLYVNDPKVKQVIKRANKAFNRIWPEEDESDDCTELLSQQLLEERKQELASVLIFIKTRHLPENHN